MGLFNLVGIKKAKPEKNITSTSEPKNIHLTLDFGKSSTTFLLS